MTLEEALIRLEKVEARAEAQRTRCEFWYKAALEWKEMYASQIVTTYPPRMAMEVLKEAGIVQNN